MSEAEGADDATAFAPLTDAELKAMHEEAVASLSWFRDVGVARSSLRLHGEVWRLKLEVHVLRDHDAKNKAKLVELRKLLAYIAAEDALSTVFGEETIKRIEEAAVGAE